MMTAKMVSFYWIKKYYCRQVLLCALQSGTPLIKVHALGKLTGFEDYILPA